MFISIVNLLILNVCSLPVIILYADNGGIFCSKEILFCKICEILPENQTKHLCRKNPSSLLSIDQFHKIQPMWYIV